MRRTAIAWLVSIGSVSAGCSFVDDFDKFKTGVPPANVDDAGDTVQPGLDSAVPPDDGGTTVGRDGGRRDGSVREQDGGELRADTGVGPVPGDAGQADAGQADAGPVSRCGDGITDMARGEECDDGNLIAGDGCEPGTCKRTPPAVCGGVSCDDGDVCTNDVCDALLGCSNRLIDNDGDGFAAGKCKSGDGLRGGDCNDANAAINSSAAEVCDGIDNNCNGMIDDGLPLLHCYPDLDGDGYATYVSGTERQLCACPSGTISVVTPIDKKLEDCYDDPKGGADVHPGQTKFFEAPWGTTAIKDRSFDYDCDGSSEPEYDALPNGSCPGLLGIAVCSVAEGYTDKVPACGGSGDYTVCPQTAILGSCSGTSSARTQACH